ncbi:hypothetical protein OU994_11420 [Pseudoduganella sp. SL102]|uniref:hypothetical protein n=1 Tax=Pseudoduganella sp. SL102 TaxID=2995154 RepID=UPI00248C6835|nr:hypothetical protein [Pseudoduganella sp. SL102]WBS04832.1 hypothetical protein OU994_11420 [Pseudoduganella sp. SL102]
MDAYQRFLDFFEMHNKERLDGLDDSYFAAMSPDERARAFEFLLEKVEAGGSEESVHGLFRANAVRATESVKALLESGRLRPRAEIAAAWNLCRTGADVPVLPVFIKGMSSADSEARTNAAYYVPVDPLTDEVKAAFEKMIRTETEQLARIHAVNGLLSGCGVSKESVGKSTFLEIYRGLHSADMRAKQAAFERLDAIRQTMN